MTAADQVLAALADPSLWDVRDGVNVFDEHTEASEVFDRPRLERLAANCNARDAIGQPCPLTLGHTEDGQPETAQPPVVGYARRFRVEWDARLQKFVIRATYYIRKDRAAEAEQYPRTSVERWPGQDVFDPIALLKRTPRLDLGQWTYGRAGRTIRYLMEARVPDAAMTPAAPTGTPPASAEPDEYSRACGHIKRYMAENFPHLGEMHTKYAASAAPAAPAAAPPATPPGPPIGPPNAAPPEKMAAESLAIQYRQLEQAVAAERYARRRAEALQAVTQLEAEGYQFIDTPNQPGSGRAREVERLAALTEAQQLERVTEIRQCYRRAPIGSTFLDLGHAPAQPAAPGGKPAMSREDMQRAQNYQRTQAGAGRPVTWEAAVEWVRTNPAA